MKYEIEFVKMQGEAVNPKPEEIEINRVTVPLTANEAQETGYHFKNHKYIGVTEGILPKYATRTIDLVVDIDGEIKSIKGKIVSIDIDVDIDTEKLLKDWGNAGYPCRWR